MVTLLGTQVSRAFSGSITTPPDKANSLASIQGASGVDSFHRAPLARPDYLYHITTGANYEAMKRAGQLSPVKGDGEDEPLICSVKLDNLLTQWVQAPPRGRSGVQKLLAHIAAKSVHGSQEQTKLVMLRIQVDPADALSVRDAYPLVCKKDPQTFKQSKKTLEQHLQEDDDDHGMYEYNFHNSIPLNRISVFAETPIRAFDFDMAELATMTQDGADLLNAYGIVVPGIAIKNPRALLKVLLNDKTVKPQFLDTENLALLKDEPAAPLFKR